MYPEFYQPSIDGAASSSYNPTSNGANERLPSSAMPINLSPEEIRTLVRDILG